MKTEIDASILEGIFDDECKCESNHKVSACSITVVARKSVRCTGASFNICESSRAVNVASIARHHPCTRCGIDRALCWTIVPV